MRESIHRELGDAEGTPGSLGVRRSDPSLRLGGDELDLLAAHVPDPLEGNARALALSAEVADDLLRPRDDDRDPRERRPRR